MALSYRFFRRLANRFATDAGIVRLRQSDLPLVTKQAVICVLSLLASTAFAADSEFAGLIRGKSPDRPSYVSPTVKTSERSAQQTFKPVRQVEAVDELAEGDAAADESDTPVLVRGRVRQVAFQTQSQTPHRRVQYESEIVDESYVQIEGSEPGCGMEPACGCEAAGFTCDGSCLGEAGCDAYRCDAGCGQCNSPSCRKCNARLCLDPCQWFGSLEVLMMWREGDGLPALVTSGNTGGAGVIGVAGTRVLFGNERVLGDLTAGGRVTIGTFLDSNQCQSFVVRGWGAEQASYHFQTDQTRNAIIARPFFNVGVNPAANGSLVIADPTRTGSIDIKGSNDVFGGDFSLRQNWIGGLGGSVDFLYGYQYMRMEDRLRIASSSFTNAAAAPPNTRLDVVDQFHSENEFHGGQFGLAARFREKKWSFNGMIKTAAGSLRRTSIRSGSTTTTTAVAAVDPNGLLVRSTNAGRMNDYTFGWVPELDASLGWRWTHNLDLTIGYHLIGMTDALQASGMIDPNLAVNASNPLVGQLSPSAALRFNTFYVQGIHFGVQVVY